MADTTPPELQLCNISMFLPDEPPCRRMAQWEWRPIEDDDPYLLCNFHAEPLTASPSLVSPITR